MRWWSHVLNFPSTKLCVRIFHTATMLSVSGLNFRQFIVKNEQRVRLKTELATCHQNDLPIEEYYKKLTKLSTSLSDYQQGKILEDIAKEREEDKLHQFLMGIDETLYGGVKSSLLSRTPLPSLDEAYKFVLRRRISSNTNSTSIYVEKLWRKYSVYTLWSQWASWEKLFQKDCLSTMVGRAYSTETSYHSSWLNCSIRNSLCFINLTEKNMETTHVNDVLAAKQVYVLMLPLLLQHLQLHQRIVLVSVGY